MTGAPSPIHLALGDSQGARGPSLTKDPGQFCVVFHTLIKGKTRLGGRERGPVVNPDAGFKAGTTTH